jgi:general secretion pathway protein G
MMKKFNFKNIKGFTLIELLVAISIIGILSSFLLANFVGARQRARDGVRKSDLRQIQAALELYRSDKGGYPLTLLACDNQFDDSLIPPSVIYMKKIPCDPSSTSASRISYTYTPSGSTYTLVACLENANDAQGDKDGSGNNIHGSCNTLWQYTLQSP